MQTQRHLGLVKKGLRLDFSCVSVTPEGFGRMTVTQLAVTPAANAW